MVVYGHFRSRTARSFLFQILSVVVVGEAPEAAVIYLGRVVSAASLLVGKQSRVPMLVEFNLPDNGIVVGRQCTFSSVVPCTLASASPNRVKIPMADSFCWAVSALPSIISLM